VIEEVARHHGYANIERTVPRSSRRGSLSPRQLDRRTLRQLLVGAGLSEAMPVPFLSTTDMDRSGLPPAPLRLANPLTAEEAWLRPSLRPGLLRALAYNASHRNQGVGLFEIGRVFEAPGAGERLPDEREHLGVVMGGSAAPDAVEIWELVRRRLGLAPADLNQVPVDGLHPTRCAWLMAGSGVLGVVGEIAPEVIESFEIGERVAWLGLDLDMVLAEPRIGGRYEAISRFPSTDLDLAFEVGDDVPAQAVEATLRTAGADLVASVELFDSYRGDQVADGTRSLAYTLRLQAADRTLTDQDIAAVRQAMINAVEADHGGRLRT